VTLAAVACLLVALVLAADLAGRRLRGVAARLPLLVLSLLLAAVALEFTCYDHGFGGVVAPVAFIGAPVVVIFGGSLAAARRWYGYPDLGPLPGRFALVGSAILLGVLAGAPLHAQQVRESMSLGEAMARHDDVLALDASTKMGLVDSPAFTWDGARATLSFPVSTTTALALDVAAIRRSPDSKAQWKRVDR
jgi:hypothetical protein